MTQPGTFDRVYAALKQRLRDGEFRPGDRLEPAALSEDLNASVTPVRDALHRLTGERLVEAPRHEGFRVPILTEAMLRHLYSWHRDLLTLAILRHRSELSVEANSEGTAALFLALANATGNPEYSAVMRSLIERLAPVHRLEDMLLDAVEEETAEIASALRAKDGKALRKSLVHYHRRRQRIVPELIARLQPQPSL